MRQAPIQPRGLLPRAPRAGVVVAAAIVCWLAAGGSLHGEPHPPPGRLRESALEGFERLPAARQAIIREALAVQREFTLERYIYGSADPRRGGFDCSGAVHYVLGRLGYRPPRSSDRQFRWLAENGVLTRVPSGAVTLGHAVFRRLRPGDLLFWAGTYEPRQRRVNDITHVEIYLGIERASGRHVMIGATSGRSYRGTRRSGYGVYDFRLPRAGSSSRFVGFGPPPGLRADD